MTGFSFTGTASSSSLNLIERNEKEKKRKRENEKFWYYERLMIHEQDIIFAWLLGDLSEYICIFVVSWRGNSPISLYLHMPPSEAFWAVPTNSKDTLEPHCFWALLRKKGAKTIWKSRRR